MLGDGGPRHVAAMRALVEAGADVCQSDRHGQQPPDLAMAKGYADMVRLLEQASMRSPRDAESSAAEHLAVPSRSLSPVRTG